MIDTKLAVQLATLLLPVKQGNVHLYNQLGAALQAISDPEMRNLLAAPQAVVQVQQGRAQMITDLLEVWFKCDEYVAQRQRSEVPVTQRVPPPQGGWVNG